jgi:hypothetical protein
MTHSRPLPNRPHPNRPHPSRGAHDLAYALTVTPASGTPA